MADTAAEAPAGAVVLALTRDGRPVVYRDWPSEATVSARDAAERRPLEQLDKAQLHRVGPVVGIVWDVH